MSFRIPSRLLLAGLCSAVLALPMVASAAEHVLRFASINLAGTVTYDKVLLPFAQALQTESDDRIEVALKPLNGYGKPTELFNLVEKGEIEIAATVQGYSPGRFPQSSVMELPLVYDNSIAGTEAMMKLHKDGLLDKDYASVKVLALYVLPPYGIFTTGKKMTQLRDLRGLRVRAPSTTVGLALAKLGTIPVGVPLTLMGDSLDNNIVDGITYGWDSLTTAKGSGTKLIKDQLSVLIDMNFAAPSLMIVMNKAAFEKLPPELRTLVDKHAASLAVDSARIREQMEAAAKQKFKADQRYTYIALTPEQRTQMQRAIAPSVDQWKAGMARQGYDGERLYNRARELVQQYKVASN